MAVEIEVGSSFYRNWLIRLNSDKSGNCIPQYIIFELATTFIVLLVFAKFEL